VLIEPSLIERTVANPPGTKGKSTMTTAHGDRDRIVPPSEGFSLPHVLGHAGARSRFELLAGAGHEDAEFDSPATLAGTAAWLRAVLGWIPE
jgi:predicted esterase